MVQLREAVTFYKNLMRPGELSEGLQVAELEVRPRQNPDLFEFDLLLTQIARRRSYIGGEISLDLVGTMSDPESGGQIDEGLQEIEFSTQDSAVQKSDDVVLSLTELNENATYPLKFRFRYFQNLTGNLLLPEGFSPRHVLITAHQKGKDALQVSFPWPRS